MTRYTSGDGASLTTWKSLSTAWVPHVTYRPQMQMEDLLGNDTPDPKHDSTPSDFVMTPEQVVFENLLLRALLTLKDADRMAKEKELDGAWITAYMSMANFAIQNMMSYTGDAAEQYRETGGEWLGLV